MKKLTLSIATMNAISRAIKYRETIHIIINKYQVRNIKIGKLAMMRKLQRKKSIKGWKQILKLNFKLVIKISTAHECKI
jgi:hypothetical protein